MAEDRAELHIVLTDEGEVHGPPPPPAPAVAPTPAAPAPSPAVPAAPAVPTLPMRTAAEQAEYEELKRRANLGQNLFGKQRADLDRLEKMTAPPPEVKPPTPTPTPAAPTPTPVVPAPAPPTPAAPTPTPAAPVIPKHTYPGRHMPDQDLEDLKQRLNQTPPVPAQPAAPPVSPPAPLGQPNRPPVAPVPTYDVLPNEEDWHRPPRRRNRPQAPFPYRPVGGGRPARPRPPRTPRPAKPRAYRGRGGVANVAGRLANRAVPGAGSTIAPIVSRLVTAHPIVAGMAAAAVGSYAVAKAFNEAADHFVKRGEELAKFSGEITQARAQANVRGMQADIKEAGELGPGIAQLTDAQSRASAEFRELVLPIKKVVVEVLGTVMGGIANTLEALNGHAGTQSALQKEMKDNQDYIRRRLAEGASTTEIHKELEKQTKLQEDAKKRNEEDKLGMGDRQLNDLLNQQGLNERLAAPITPPPWAGVLNLPVFQDF